MRWPAGLAEQMHADHVAGMRLFELQQKYGKTKTSIRQAFEARGMKLIPWSDGRFVRTLKLKTKKELITLAGEMTRVVVHPAIKTEWREWSMEKRKWWIALVRERLGPLHSRPSGEFSSNVVPFEYGDAILEDWLREKNGGKSSHTAGCKVKVCSQGVMWGGALWFWSRKAGYQEGIPWHIAKARRLLHVAIYESVHGPTPPHSVIRYNDGNWNNLDPGNLRCETRNNLARENQAKSLTAKSRAKTAALLKLSKSPPDQYEFTKLFQRTRR